MLGLSACLTDYWQMVALGEQHNRACEFGVKTVVLSACGKCVRQTEFVECGLNSLVRQQYGCESFGEWHWQFLFKLVFQHRYKRIILGKVQALIQNLACHALRLGVRKTLRHGITVICESQISSCGDKLRVLQSLGVMLTHVTS